MNHFSPSGQPSRRSIPRRFGVAIAVALAATMVLGTPSSARAESGDVATSQLKWGFKSSFRTYITLIAAGTATASDGATKDSGPASAPYTWSGAGGTYDTESGTGSLEFAGKVVFRSTAHSIWHITLANPTIEVDGDGTGSLIADVSFATGGSEAAPEKSGEHADVAIADLTIGDPAVNGTTLTLSDVPAVLTEAGAEAFDGFYEAGTELDSLTLTATVEPTEPEEPTDPEEPEEPTEPAPANDLGKALSGLLGSTTTTVQTILTRVLALLAGLS